MLALEASRENSSHFENIYSYWSWNINSYCEEDDVSRDYDSVGNASLVSSSHSQHDVPTLTTASSCYSTDKNISICAKKPINMMRHQEEEPEREED